MTGQESRVKARKRGSGAGDSPDGGRGRALV